LAAAAAQRSSCHLVARTIPVSSFFGPLLLLFAIHFLLSLLPTKANKTSKNPKDDIII